MKYLADGAGEGVLSVKRMVFIGSRAARHHGQKRWIVGESFALLSARKRCNSVGLRWWRCLGWGEVGMAGGVWCGGSSS